MKFFQDILKEYNKITKTKEWSQGRVYLFVSIIAYYLTLTLITLAGLSKKHNNLDLNNFEIVIEALKYAMALFAGYVLGGKALEVIKAFQNKKEEE
jgi:hypothetical protein